MSYPLCSQPAFYQKLTNHNYEKQMNKVVLLTTLMMVVEIIGGWWLGSMALLADGFHMVTHAVALGISAFAYGYARRHRHDPRYSFGTGKVGDLAGFTSAIILLVVTGYIAVESGMRLLSPVPIAYGEATIVAALGLGINIASAFILGHDTHSHDHSHGHDHVDGDHHHQHDNNFRSAYVHVLADAVTSVAALAALLCGRYLGWGWMDPVIGLAGAGVILSWAIGLLRDTSAVLLDRETAQNPIRKIQQVLADHKINVVDLHVWRVGHGCHAVVVTVVSAQAMTGDSIRDILRPLDLAHVTVEIVSVVR